LRGHCTWFSGKFGFLRPVGGADDGQDDVFVHATAVEHFPGGQVHADDYVEFKVATHNNRPRAVDVVLLQASDAAY
jgi:cold shock CspA family protein